MAAEVQKAVLLLSGGLDSATAGAIARAAGYALHALSFDYGQRHRHELDAAARVAEALGVVEHRRVSFDLRVFGGSALTDEIEVPKHAASTVEDDIPVTYVPARNTIFLSFALGFAEVIDAGAIVIGVNALDYSGYPDCRPAFIEAFERLARLATKAGVEGRKIVVHAPLLHLNKAEIIRRGVKLGVDYGLTHSCYDPDGDGTPCGACDSCTLRAAGFREAGVEDPALR
ncbi:MAG: 7-cyano-7-deazaguanine synthase QueC [Planctomycetes bacterium]|nr:7-cyano-7-deazaguanine synthase QueC [Planctomycetota bacterium]